MAVREFLMRAKQLHPAPPLQVHRYHGLVQSVCLSSSATEEQSSKPSGSWLQKLKGFFGSQEEGLQSAVAPPSKSLPVSSEEQFTLEVFADELKKAQAFGKLTEFGRGLPSGGEKTAARSLSRQEDILRKLATYSTDGQRLKAEQKSEVAVKCGCTVRDVDNVLSKYAWAREANARILMLKAEGKPLPKSLDEVVQMMGSSWNPAASVNLSKDEQPSRNVPCPCGSGKKYKRCCGKS